MRSGGTVYKENKSLYYDNKGKRPQGTPFVEYALKRKPGERITH
jgi:hypothetical protein